VKVPVYASSLNCDFLKANRPFSHLVERNNIELRDIENGPIALGENIKVESFPVRHRNEDGDTCGFVISGPNNRIIYLPDLDEWDETARNAVNNSTVAIVDGTYSTEHEIPQRSDRNVRHPTIEETRNMFRNSPAKLQFTHFNHTNALAGKEMKIPGIIEL
jgi:pyrroloquinoline quinone biosynthesis protein B